MRATTTRGRLVTQPPHYAGGRMQGTCQGCSQDGTVHRGPVVRRGEDPEKATRLVDLCLECWEAVECADPETGAYGASAVELMPSTVADYRRSLGVPAYA